MNNADTPAFPVKLVAIRICQPCLDGEGRECHTPGCSRFLHRVDLRTFPELYEVLPDDFSHASLRTAGDALAGALRHADAFAVATFEGREAIYASGITADALKGWRDLKPETK